MGKLKKTLGWTAGLSGVAGFLYSADMSVVFEKLSVIAHDQIAQAGFFFTLAAFIHSTQVKKEIKLSFSSLTDAITGLSVALRQELKNHADRLDNHSIQLDTLRKSVAELSAKEQPKHDDSKGGKS